MSGGYIVVEVNKCLACKTCEIECAIAHSEFKDKKDAVFKLHSLQHRVFVEKMKEFSIPLQCRHCEDAPCVKICPTKAIEKREIEGPVVINESLCIGCKRCLLICPFGVISINHQSRASIKCDLCIGRLKEGLSPACVSGCPTKAIKYISIDEYNKLKRRRVIKEYYERVGKK
jgi:carbon-monoxide dehydrogenase iron sulfur subunit